jgi:hypothetical protein
MAESKSPSKISKLGKGGETPERVGATSSGVPSPQESAQDEDLRDLFLTEENLIRLAIGHLGGKAPPKVAGRNRRSRPSIGDGVGVHGSQTARTRRGIAAKLQRELHARSWTASELADVSKLSLAECRSLISGQAVFTPDVAKQLALVFATSDQYWLSDRLD